MGLRGHIGAQMINGGMQQMGKLAEKFLNMMRFTDDEEDYYEDYEEFEEEDADFEPEVSAEEEDHEDRGSSRPFMSFRRKKKEKEKEVEVDADYDSLASNVVPFSKEVGEGEVVKVIRPQTFNEAQLVADFLKEGKTIVVNLEGIEISQAQRIIDFIGGASFAIDGTLRAISNNIFIVAPGNIEVSGDLRDEIVNDDMLSPELS